MANTFPATMDTGEVAEILGAPGDAVNYLCTYGTLASTTAANGITTEVSGDALEAYILGLVAAGGIA